MQPEWLAYCHCCMVAHTLWATGETWQCQRCTFRIPLAHLWWWCPLTEEPRIIVQEAALTQMELF